MTLWRLLFVECLLVGPIRLAIAGVLATSPGTVHVTGIEDDPLG